MLADTTWVSGPSGNSAWAAAMVLAAPLNRALTLKLVPAFTLPGLSKILMNGVIRFRSLGFFFFFFLAGAFLAAPAWGFFFATLLSPAGKEACPSGPLP